MRAVHGTIPLQYGISEEKGSRLPSDTVDGEFAVGDLLKSNKLYKTNFYDVIVAIELIEHIPPTKIFELHKMVRSLLNKRGLYIISTPLNEGLRQKKINPSAHLREYTLPIIQTEFKLSNFKTIQMQTFFAFTKLYILKKYLARILNRWNPNNIVVVAKNLS